MLMKNTKVFVIESLTQDLKRLGFIRVAPERGIAETETEYMRRLCDILIHRILCSLDTSLELSTDENGYPVVQAYDNGREVLRIILGVKKHA